MNLTRSKHCSIGSLKWSLICCIIEFAECNVEFFSGCLVCWGTTTAPYIPLAICSHTPLSPSATMIHKYSGIVSLWIMSWIHLVWVVRYEAVMVLNPRGNLGCGLLYRHFLMLLLACHLGLLQSLEWIVPLNVMALYLIPPGWSALSGATSTTTSCATKRRWFHCSLWCLGISSRRYPWKAWP